MSDFTGDDLLKVFKELDVQLLNLNPNVIKAWFDTDDKNMKNLLNWMCVSLSKENYVSPLEVIEYSSIETTMGDTNLEKEKGHLEHEYPGIFDPEYNAIEIEFLEEELNLMQQQERELNHEILLNRNLEEQLSKELSKKVKEEIEISVKLKTIQEKCLTASEKLDSLNNRIYDKIMKCAKVLHNFEFSPSPLFINNFDINMYQEKLDNVFILLKPVIEKSSNTGNITALTNITNIDGYSIDDTIADHLCNMRHRILHSQNKYLATTIEVEKLKAVLTQLEKCTIESLLSTDESSLNQSISIKLDTKRKLCDMLEDVTKHYADRHISQSQVRHLEQELDMCRSNLDELRELEVIIQKMLSHYLLLGILYDLEKKDIEKFDKYFKQIMTHISRDMESCVVRTEKMREIIDEYKSSSSNERLKLTKTIIRMLSNDEENFSIGRAYKLISDIKQETDFLESKLFTPAVGDIKSRRKDLRDSVKVLRSFLISGPTHRVLLVPTELQIVIRQVEEILKKELESVKSAMVTVSSMKKVPSKWQNFRRQLWMYFYADPTHLKFILQQIEEEFKASKVNQKGLQDRTCS